jgi:hypothetical protein
MARESILLETEATLPLVRVLAGALRGVLYEWGVPDGQRALLELALVEAATNVARHAYLSASAAVSRSSRASAVSLSPFATPDTPSIRGSARAKSPTRGSVHAEGGMGIPS